MRRTFSGPVVLSVIAALLSFLSITVAQTGEIYHQLEGRLQNKNAVLPAIRVRLVRRDSLEPVAETFTRTDGGFVFSRVTDGDYLIETFETEAYEATSTEASFRPRPRRSTFLSVNIEVPTKNTPGSKPGVINADVDLAVPKSAQKHYQNGSKALKGNNFVVAEKEWRQAISIYSNYYQARMDLGRELRQKKRFSDGAEILFPLLQIAPNRADPRLEYGICMLELSRPDEAAAELRRAVQLEPANWTSQLYLGWALQDSTPDEAEQHFVRALELNERKAARAYLSLARIADSEGKTEVAITYLESFLKLMPNASDAEVARQLLAKLRG